MNTYIGAVTIVTDDKQKHSFTVYRDLNQLRQSFTHPYHVLTTTARQKCSELENDGFKIQSIIIDRSENIWW